MQSPPQCCSWSGEPCHRAASLSAASLQLSEDGVSGHHLCASGSHGQAKHVSLAPDTIWLLVTKCLSHTWSLQRCVRSVELTSTLTNLVPCSTRMFRAEQECSEPAVAGLASGNLCNAKPTQVVTDSFRLQCQAPAGMAGGPVQEGE